MKTVKRISGGSDLPVHQADVVESVDAEEVDNPIFEQSTEELIAIRSRFLEFIEQENPSKVAARIGDNPHKYYHMRKGKAFPSLETIMRVASAYPDKFDRVYVLTGQRLTKSSNAVPATYVTETVAALEAKIREDLDKQYQGIIKEKDARIKSAEEDKARMWDLLGKNEGVADDPFESDSLMLRKLFRSSYVG